MAWKTMTCELCSNEDLCNEHHLIPRKCHSKKYFLKIFTKLEMKTRIAMLCKSCHKEIHKLIPNEVEMGKKYNTIELLMAHPLVKKYVTWKRRKNRSSNSE